MQRKHATSPANLLSAAIGTLIIAGLGAICSAPAVAAPGDFPHWDGESCNTCHGEGTPVAIENYDAPTMCGKCHDESDTLSCRHPTDIGVGGPGSMALPENFQGAIRDGKLVCTTCHDPLVQCQGDKLAPYLNPRFLRGGPFQQRDEVCLLCHDAGDYGKLNPHKQLAGGEAVEQVCGFCHAAAAERITASTGFRMDASLQCLGCHPVAPHPMSMIPGSGIDSWNHLVVPGESTLRQMTATRARTGARLPVEPATGKITCSTCHDPHEAGVIDGDPAFLERARMRPVARCENCHEK